MLSIVESEDKKTTPIFSLDTDPSKLAELHGIPRVDFKKNFPPAIAAGRGMLSMLGDVVHLRFGPGRLTSNEYYYYRLWEPSVSEKIKRSYIGKLAQHSMHLICNDPEWKAAAADKLVFHSLMTGASLPVPELLAVVHPNRSLPGVLSLRDSNTAAWFLRDIANYPLFAKPIDGMYSLAILSADSVWQETIVMRGAGGAPVSEVAAALTATKNGFLIQRRLAPVAPIADAFGDRLWSVRMLMLLGPDGPILHRATAKIPTGNNPADNYWRTGNLLGALDRKTGRIERVVTGSAESFRVLETHPDTGGSFANVSIPQWQEAVELVNTAAVLLPGIRTQSWDIAITDRGPVILEVNWGGDLNLSQLASGRGAFDGAFHQHLLRNGYKEY